MALIRRYGEFPAMFVPDVGEVVRAALSPAGPYVRAVVTSVHRADRDFIRVGVQWLEDGGASPGAKPVRKGIKGSVYIRRDDRIPLIRRIPAA